MKVVEELTLQLNISQEHIGGSVGSFVEASRGVQFIVTEVAM